MFTLKSDVTAITIGIAAFLGLEAYGFYSIYSLLETRLSQLETGIESVRAADAAIASQIEAAQTARKEAGSAKAKDVKPVIGNGNVVVSPKVAAKLLKMLPPRTKLNEASAGFKNDTEFISAVYISKDLGIPFARLKAKVTGSHAVSIEAAIRDLRPNLSKAKAKAEVEKGQRQAVEIAKLGKSASGLT
jgi:hypothetical protein